MHLQIFNPKAIFTVALAFLLVGCAAFPSSVKKSAESTGTPAASSAAEPDKPVSTEAEVKPEFKKPSTSRPPYEPPAPPPKEKIAEGSVDLRLKGKVTEAALEFAKNVPGVVNVKTCYSRVHGAWYLFLYVKKGKKIQLQHYSYNERSGEWDVLYNRIIDAKRLPSELKADLPDEECFILK